MSSGSAAASSSMSSLRIRAAGPRPPRPRSPTRISLRTLEVARGRTETTSAVVGCIFVATAQNGSLGLWGEALSCTAIRSVHPRTGVPAAASIGPTSRHASWNAVTQSSPGSADWVTAFQEAWREVGPIDAAAGTPVRGWTERIAVQESASPHKPSDPFWAVATKMQPTTAEVVSVRPLATSSVRKLILVGLLGRGGRGPAARIRRELIDELAAAEPDDMTYVLMRLLDGSTGNQPLSDDDFPALEEAVGRPRFGVSLASLYEAYRSDLEAAADPDPVSHAFTAAIVAFPEAPGTLWLRAKATQEAGLPVAGERLAAVLQRVGRELAVQTSLLARLIGEQTLVRAALLRGDLAGAKAARAELATTLALHREGKVREEYLSGWPVPGLLHELTDRMGRDEIALFRDLVQLPVRADSLPASR